MEIDKDELILLAVEAYEDGTLGVYRCVERYCEENGIDPDIGEESCNEWFESERRYYLGF